MSDLKAAAAVDTLLLTDHKSETLGFDMYALIELIQFDYERWCRIIGMNPDDEASGELFDVTRYGYINTWKELGEQGFTKAMRPYLTKWQSILAARA